MQVLYQDIISAHESTPTHLFIGENVVLRSECTLVYFIPVVSSYVLYYCKYYSAELIFMR